MRRIALFSTWEKEGLDTIARALVDRGMECVATGNTRTVLEQAGIAVTDISDLTGEPERFGGRVKTLHHRVFGGILFRPGQDEAEWPEGYRVEAVVCNFYPFIEKAAETRGVEEMMQWVDIGGPSMVRAAAKNHAHVWVFTRKEQYARFIADPQELVDEDGARRLRERFALEAFEGVAELDEAIAREFRWRHLGAGQGGGGLTYGENPHQDAFFSVNPATPLTLIGSPSFNNLRDAEAAFRFASAFRHPAVAVVKHQTLCGAAAGLADSSPSQVFKWAWEGDTVSRFGGILGLNFLPGPEISEILRTKFIEVVVLPRSAGAERLARDVIAVKPKVRFVLVGPSHYERALDGKLPCAEIYQGWLTRVSQRPDFIEYDPQVEGVDFNAHFHRFGQWAAACSKSNAMVLCGTDANAKIAYLAGTGQGQPNRLDALKRLAIPRATEFAARMNLQTSDFTCFSDAFLSHTDSLGALSEIGVKKLVQPGGSKADADVAAEAQRLGIQMTITGRRHFWH